MAGMEDATPGTSSARRPGMGLGTQILIGMVLGSFLGAVLGERVTVIQPVGDLFIRLLVLAAIPLVFFNLLAGLTALSDVRTFGRLATKIMSYYVVTDLVGLSLGLAAVALLRPGVGMQLTEQVEGTVGAVPSIGDVLLGMVPSNVFRAFADGNVVQLVVVAVLLGIATLMLTGSTRDRLSVAFSDLAALFRRLVDLILLVAPLGIGALMAVTVGRYGASMLGPMTKFLLGVYAGQLVIFVGYMVLLRAFTDRRPLQFLRDTGPLWATTAATTSMSPRSRPISSSSRSVSRFRLLRVMRASFQSRMAVMTTAKTFPIQPATSAVAVEWRALTRATMSVFLSAGYAVFLMLN